MIKNVVTCTLMILLSFSVSGWAKEKKMAEVVSVKKGPNGYTLSVNAHNTRLEKIINKLIE